VQKFFVTVTQEIEADTAEEAALLLYQSLSRGPAPTVYSVRDESGTVSDLTLDRARADEFSSMDHTADPGNW
jgi:hypothetical protein